MDKNLPYGQQDSNSPFTRGGIAGVANIMLTFPINKVMFRQQLHGDGFAQAFLGIYREGVWKLYRGLPPPLFQKAISTSLMFGIYNDTNQIMTAVGMGGMASHVIASTTSGTIEATLTPFERVQTILQDPKYNRRFKSFSTVVWEMRLLGLKEYYRGFSAVVIRNVVSNCVFFMARERLTSIMTFASSKGTRKNATVLVTTGSFASGAILGGTVSCIVFPINVAKSHMQKHWGGDFGEIWSAFMREKLKRGSFFAMWRGVQLNVLRSCLSWGIVNTVYEYGR